MNKRIQAGTLDSLVMAFTAPIVSLEAVRSISNQMYSIAEILSILVGAYMLHLVGGAANKERLIKHGGKLVIGDYLFWVVLAIGSFYFLEMRYFAMVVLSPIFYDTKKVVIRVVINRNLSGDELSNFSIRSDKLLSIAAAIGFGLSLTCMELEFSVGIGTALLIGRVANLPYAYSTYQIWRSGSRIKPV